MFNSVSLRFCVYTKKKNNIYPVLFHLKFDRAEAVEYSEYLRYIWNVPYCRAIHFRWKNTESNYKYGGKPNNFIQQIWTSIGNTANRTNPAYSMSHVVSTLCLIIYLNGLMRLVFQYWFGIMMTSSNGNMFRVTGHLCGKFTGTRRLPCTKASGAEFCCFSWFASG